MEPRGVAEPLSLYAFPPDDPRVVSGSRRSAKAHVYFNKWKVLSHCDMWMTPFMGVLTQEEVPWSAIELIAHTSGATRRIPYDAAMWPYQMEEPSELLLHYHRGRAAERRQGRVSGAVASVDAVLGLDTAPSGTVGTTGGDPHVGVAKPNSAVGTAGQPASGPVGSTRPGDSPRIPHEFIPGQPTPPSSEEEDGSETVGSTLDNGYAFPVTSRSGSASTSTHGKRRRARGSYDTSQPGGEGGGTRGGKRTSVLSSATSSLSTRDSPSSARGRSPKGGKFGSGAVGATAKPTGTVGTTGGKSRAASGSVGPTGRGGKGKAEGKRSAPSRALRDEDEEAE